MARQRYINTDYWRDEYIEELDPLERYLFIYFLTNPLTNIAGIYKISVKRIAFETGLDKDMVVKMLERFTQKQKIAFIDGYIVIKNFIKHQKLNPNIKKGIDEILKELPLSVMEWLHAKPLKGYTNPLNYVNVNVNVNSNDNVNNNDKGGIDKIPFNDFWNLYDKKVDKEPTEKKWNKLPLKDQQDIIDYLPKYKLSQPVKKFRKNPATFLNQKSWHNEIITDDKQGFQDKIKTLKAEDYHNGKC